MAFARSLGKELISAFDMFGFIVNWLLLFYLFDVVRVYEYGLGMIEDIDKGMTFGCGYLMGLFILFDFRSQAG